MQEEIKTNKMGKYVSKSRQILLVFFGVTIVYIFLKSYLLETHTKIIMNKIISWICFKIIQDEDK